MSVLPTLEPRLASCGVGGGSYYDSFGEYQGRFVLPGDVVPEPSTWTLLGLGTVVVLYQIRRRLA